MMEALADQVELNSLMMTANKQSHLDRSKAMIASLAGQNGVAATAPTTGADDAITNRSPKTETTNNNYPVRSDAPWVALIALLALGALALAFMWMASQPKATTATNTGNPPGNYNVDARPF